jgi:ABC-type multidrug transport system ATPase subunit
LTQDALVVDRLTVAYRRVIACNEVSLRIPAGSIYALLGRIGAGKSSLLACLAGDRKPSGGRALLFGMDCWRERRKLRPLLAHVPAEPRRRLQEVLDRALGPEARCLLLDEPDLGEGTRRAEARKQVRAAAGRGTTILLATSRAAEAEGLADRIGMLHGSRLLLDDSATELAGRFREIRYRNEITSTRTEYGTELDAFEAVRVRVRGWGIQAVVSNFSHERFQLFRSLDGVADAEALPMTLDAIFDAVAPEALPASR